MGATETQGLLGARQSPDQGRQQITSWIGPALTSWLGRRKRSKTVTYSAGCGQASGGRTNQDRRGSDSGYLAGARGRAPLRGRSAEEGSAGLGSETRK